jgi:hypothetical protein
MARIKKTDNSYLQDKIHLRINHLPPGDEPINVLDCYAGEGTIWRNIKRLAQPRTFRVLPIDTRKDIGFHLPGDNLGFLASLDLTKFHVIDLL